MRNGATNNPAVEFAPTSPATGDNRAAFIAELKNEHDRLRALALRVLNDPTAADDALQDAYVKAYQQRHSFRGESSRSTWLYTIVYRCCVDQYRRRPPTVSLDAVVERSGHDPLDRATPFEQLIGDRLSLRDAMEHLSPEQRAVIWLVDGEGMTFAMAARVLGLPPGTVGSRVSRGRATLRDLLARAHCSESGGEQ